MKIEHFPLVSLYEISGIIAQRYMFYGHNEQALTRQIYLSLRREMTDTNETIIRYYIPNKKSYLEEYTVEFQIILAIVMKNCGLSWGDCFLIDLTF